MKYPRVNDVKKVTHEVTFQTCFGGEGYKIEKLSTSEKKEARREE